MKNQIVIDLCKIGYGVWILMTCFLVLGAIYSYTSLPYYKEDNTKEACPTSDGWVSENSFCNDKHQLVIQSWCSKGLFDKNEYCISDSTTEYFYVGHFDFGVIWIPFLILNSINGFALFIMMNRKYKTFAFRTCSGSILNERQNLRGDKQ